MNERGEQVACWPCSAWPGQIVVVSIGPLVALDIELARGGGGAPAWRGGGGREIEGEKDAWVWSLGFAARERKRVREF